MPSRSTARTTPAAARRGAGRTTASTATPPAGPVRRASACSPLLMDGPVRSYMSRRRTAVSGTTRDEDAPSGRPFRSRRGLRIRADLRTFGNAPEPRPDQGPRPFVVPTVRGSGRGEGRLCRRAALLPSAAIEARQDPPHRLVEIGAGGEQAQ